MDLNVFQADSADNSAMTGLAHRRADGLAHLTGSDSFLLLQLFADGAEGEAASTGEAAAAPDAGETTEESFDTLIKGKYKNDFDTRVQAILRSRFRKDKDRSEDTKSIISTLAGKYGMGDDPDKVDLKALHTAMTAQEAVQKKEAARRAAYENILAQTKTAQELYPALDLNAELDNPAFAQLLRSHVPVQTAYEVVHKDEILRGSMAYAAKVAAQKVGAAVQANIRRPQENGLGSSAGASVDVSDPRFLTKEMRQDIRKRVRRGEKIVW